MALLSKQQKVNLTEFVTNGSNIKYVRGFINSRLNNIYKDSGVKKEIFSPQYEYDVSLGYLKNN